MSILDMLVSVLGVLVLVVLRLLRRYLKGLEDKTSKWVDTTLNRNNSSKIERSEEDESTRLG